MTSFVVAGGSVINTVGHVNQDRWAVGCGPQGCWLIVSDGISADSQSHAAAELAVAVAVRSISTSALLEGDALQAVDLAAAAVAPSYQDSDGGCTLTIAAVTAHRATIVSVGDSPGFVAVKGRLERLTPPSRPGPLTSWIGSTPQSQPVLWSKPLDPTDDLTLVVASDGLALDGQLLPSSELGYLVDWFLVNRRVPHGDDATVTVATLRREASQEDQVTVTYAPSAQTLQEQGRSAGHGEEPVGQGTEQGRHERR